MMITVKASDLRVHDTFADGSYVTEVITDSDGTWVETSDGDNGYIERSVRIERYHGDLN